METLATHPAEKANLHDFITPAALYFWHTTSMKTYQDPDLDPDLDPDPDPDLDQDQDPDPDLDPDLDQDPDPDPDPDLDPDQALDISKPVLFSF
jgi:hypothetical protein